MYIHINILSVFYNFNITIGIKIFEGIKEINNDNNDIWFYVIFLISFSLFVPLSYSKFYFSVIFLHFFIQFLNLIIFYLGSIAIVMLTVQGFFKSVEIIAIRVFIELFFSYFFQLLFLPIIHQNKSQIKLPEFEIFDEI